MGLSNAEAALHANVIMSALDVDQSGNLDANEFVNWVQIGLRRPTSIRQIQCEGNPEQQQLERFLLTVQSLALELDKSKSSTSRETKIVTNQSSIDSTKAHGGLSRSKTQFSF